MIIFKDIIDSIMGLEIVGVVLLVGVVALGALLVYASYVR